VAGGIPAPVAVDYHTRGYWDVACGGEAAGGEPTDCQAPVPSPPADAPRRPLHVDRLAITLDHVGHYDVTAGQAVLPEGYLTEARFRVDGDALPGMTTTDGIVLELRSADSAGRPFDNVHSHGVHRGPETVDVHLVLDVTALGRPTTVDVIDLDVR
jgi:hypothetical protein